MLFHLLVLSAIQFAFVVAPGKKKHRGTPVPKPKDYRTHIISFYGVTGPVKAESIRDASTNLIILYDKKMKELPVEVKHHYDAKSAALIEILEFWPKLLTGLGTAELKERNEKIKESVEYVKRLLDGIDTKIYQRVMYKMTEDGFGGHFEHVYPFWSKDKIEKVMVFYKHAFEDIYELVRVDYVRLFPRWHRDTAFKDTYDLVRILDDLFESAPNLICDAMSERMQVSIAADLSKLAEAAVNLNALINGAMIKQQIVEWEKYGLLKLQHVDIYFNALHPMPVLGPTDADFEVVKYCVKNEGTDTNSNKVESFPDYFDNGHYDAMLREYALQHSRMMRSMRAVYWRCFGLPVIVMGLMVYLLTLITLIIKMLG